MKRYLLRAFAALMLLTIAGPLGAATTMQFPTTPWGGFAPALAECGSLIGANFNSTADQPITVTFPSRHYLLDEIVIDDASTSMTTAAGGFYTAASKGGVTLVASSQVYSTLTGAAVDAAGSLMTATLATAALTTTLDLNTLYFSLTTAQGATATANIRLFCRPLY